MRTIDSQITTDSAWGRWRRDARMLMRLGGMIFGYVTAGGKIRRRYRAKARDGEIYWVDTRGGE